LGRAEVSRGEGKGKLDALSGGFEAKEGHPTILRRPLSDGEGEGGNGRGWVYVSGGTADRIVDDRVGGSSVGSCEAAVGREEGGLREGWG